MSATTTTRVTNEVKDLLLGTGGSAYATGAAAVGGWRHARRDRPHDRRDLDHPPMRRRAEVTPLSRPRGRAFDNGPWPRMSPRERSDALRRLTA